MIITKKLHHRRSPRSSWSANHRRMSRTKTSSTAFPNLTPFYTIFENEDSELIDQGRICIEILSVKLLISRSRYSPLGDFEKHSDFQLCHHLLNFLRSSIFLFFFSSQASVCRCGCCHRLQMLESTTTSRLDMFAALQPPAPSPQRKTRRLPPRQSKKQ